MVLVGDHVTWPAGTRMVEDAVSGGRALVEGRTDDLGQAPALLRRHRPDVVVVEARPAVIRDLSSGPAPLLVLAADVELGSALAALRAGARGVLPAGADPAVLVPTLLAIATGLSVVPGEFLPGLAGPSPAREGRTPDGLSPEDRELWRMVSEGLETAIIAERLFVSERTTKRMVASLLRRLRVANRVQAAALAGQTGLLDEVAPGEAGSPPRTREEPP